MLPASLQLTVLVGSTFNESTFNPTTFTECASNLTASDYREYRYFHCEPSIVGQFVAVAMIGEDELILCEVQIYEINGNTSCNANLYLVYLNICIYLFVRAVDALCACKICLI